MIKSHIIVSVTRTDLYGTKAAPFAISESLTRHMLEPTVLRCVHAVYASWLIYSLPTLPEEIWHGTCETIVNTLFGVFMFRCLDSGTVFEGEVIAVGFAACRVLLFSRYLLCR